MKAGIKADTWNQLQNASLFGLDLFLDSVICTDEQDITKFESSSMPPGHGLGASQHTQWWSSHRYKPYERKEPKAAP